MAYYPSQGRAPLASSMGLRPGTQDGTIANIKGRPCREFDLMLGYEDLKRPIHEGLVHVPPSSKVRSERLCECACAVRLLLPLRNYGLGGFAQARYKTRVLGWR